MPKLDLDTAPQTNASNYPPPFNEPMADRWYRRLAPVAGLTKLGASHVTLKPGAWSSQRHWHRVQDELLVMLMGEAVLVEDDSEVTIRPGDVVAWAAGYENGHHVINRGQQDCTFIVVCAGSREEDSGEYSDIDMVFDALGYARKDGTRYPGERLP